MGLKIHEIAPDEWKKYAESAHTLTFGKHRSASTDRCDKALLIVTETEQPFGFLTMKEIDADHVYWQFGGGFGPNRNPINTLHGYRKFISWHHGKYKYITHCVDG